MKFLIAKDEYGYLKPIDIESVQIYQKMEVDKAYECEIQEESRNSRFHRKFFALMKIVLDMQERYDNVNDLRVEVLLRGGFYHEHITLTGKMVYQADSMSFSSMSKKKFEELYSKSIDVCLKYFCQGLTPEILEQQVDRVLNFS